MNLYEVVFYGAVGRSDDADTIYLVRAPDFRTAIETTCHSLSSEHHDFSKGTPIPDLVLEIGRDLSLLSGGEPVVLRGPYVQCAYEYGWRRWTRRVDDDGVQTNDWEETRQED